MSTAEEWLGDGLGYSQRAYYSLPIEMYPHHDDYLRPDMSAFFMQKELFSPASRALMPCSCKLCGVVDEIAGRKRSSPQPKETDGSGPTELSPAAEDMDAGPSQDADGETLPSLSDLGACVEEETISCGEEIAGEGTGSNGVGSGRPVSLSQAKVNEGATSYLEDSGGCRRSVKLTVWGDIHGSVHSILRSLQRFIAPESWRYVLCV